MSALLSTPSRAALRLVLTLTVAGLPFATASANEVETETNDFFEERYVVPNDSTSVSASLGPSNLPGPDTLLGRFDEFGSLLESDDDSSFLGDGLASGLFNVPINDDGSISVAVTGLGNDLFLDDFSVFHSEFGSYELFIDVFDNEGGFVSGTSYFDELNGEDADFFMEADEAWIGGTFDAYIDNTVQLGDVDWFEFTGLTPGVVYTAEITQPNLGVEDPELDTYLEAFDTSFNFLANNDDNDESLLSQLNAAADDTGSLVFAVTGFPDFFYAGNHPEFGDYVLTVTEADLSALSGDFDGDGQVAQGDLNFVLNNWGGQRGEWANADGLETSIVDQEELNRVLNNWGATVAPPATSAVPEPALAGLACLAALRLRRRR